MRLRPEGRAGSRAESLPHGARRTPRPRPRSAGGPEFRMRRGEELARIIGIAPHILRERHDMGDAGRPLALRRRQLTGPGAALVRAFGTIRCRKRLRAAGSGKTCSAVFCSAASRSPREISARRSARPRTGPWTAARSAHDLDHRAWLHPGVLRSIIRSLIWGSYGRNASSPHCRRASARPRPAPISSEPVRRLRRRARRAAAEQLAQASGEQRVAAIEDRREAEEGRAHQQRAAARAGSPGRRTAGRTRRRTAASWGWSRTPENPARTAPGSRPRPRSTSSSATGAARHCWTPR